MRNLLQLSENSIRPIRRWLLIAAFSCITVFPALLPAQVVINEIMYHPYEPFGVTNYHEFVEIFNAGSNAVDLSNYRFDNGISYRFPTNTVIGSSNYVVLCENLTAFSTAYPSVTNCIGSFSGNLNNGGERVTLSREESNSWVTVDTIRYLDIGPSDGGGSSLELVHEGFARLRNHYYGAWASSTTASGTPGVVNSVYNANPAPVVGDVKHDPPLPFEGSSITITARIAAYDSDRLAAVSLEYRKDAASPPDWSSLNMIDDGLNGDEIARDGVYSIRLPEFEGDDFVEGDILSFRILATDEHGESISMPATNTSGDNVAGEISYLCYFGEDTAYDGEYDTYHIIVTEENESALLAQSNQNIDYPLLDATFITAEGDVYYNCGVRQRGGTSRNESGWQGGTYPRNFRVEFPDGSQLDGYRDINLNHLNALNQYLGHTLISESGYGNVGSDVKLVRVWVNDIDRSDMAKHRIYVRMEKIGRKYASRHFENDQGNLYQGKDDNATLDLKSDAMDYNNGYWIPTTNNPLTIWHSLSNLCYYINQPLETYPTSLTNRMNVRQWARHFAMHVVMNNTEGGLCCPGDTKGDDFALYAEPVSGQFYLLPWDLDSVVSSSTADVWGYGSGNESARTRKYLFHHPVSPFYVGDVLDVFDNVCSPANLNAIFDRMGSKVDSRESTYLNNLATSEANLLSKINTNLTISISDVIDEGPLATVVSNSAVSMSGQAPQNYTATVSIDGSPTDWDAYNVGAMQTEYGKWSTTNDLSLDDGANEVVLQTLDSYGSVILSRDLLIVRKTSSASTNGTIAVNTTWDSSGGIIEITGNIDVTNGATLTIASNTTVLVASGMTIGVTSGSLSIEGTEDFPVWVLPEDGGSSWTIDAGDQSLTASNAVFAGGTITADGGNVLLQDCRIRDNPVAGGIITSSGGASVTMRRCVVSDYAKTSFNASSLLSDNCLFSDMSDAGIEIISGVATVQSTTVRSPDGGGTDGIRASSSADVLVTKCLVYGVADAGISADSSSNVECRDGLVHSTGKGLSVSGATLANINNTIADNTTGIEGSQSVTNCIIWSNTASMASGPAQVYYTDLEQSGTNSYNGTGNLNQNPWFRNAAIDDYRLRSFSPCLGSGEGGADMGAFFPVGANPPTPSAASITNGLASGTNFITLSWSLNDHADAAIEVQRSIEGEDWTTVADLAAGSTNYTDPGLIQDTEYHYRLKASHERGESYWSDSAVLITGNEASTDRYKKYLRITEIMYNPDGSDDAEFIEVQNTWSNEMNMTGLYFDQDRFTFPTGTVLAAGEFFVIARDGIAFSNAYPGAECDDIWDIDNDLENDQESVWIKDATGEKVFEVDYTDDPPWPTAADGDGPSLVLIDPSAPPPEDSEYDYTKWRASTLYGGSAGKSDPSGSVVINEVLTHQDDAAGDWIELHNPGDALIDISGYYLSDHPTNTMKYQVPASTTIPSGGFVVFNERDHFGVGINGFALSELGEAVYLSDTTGTNVTEQSFGAAERDVTFGRHTRSDGQVDFTAMSSQTSGSSNSYPKVGPVVVNEIMYNPAATGKEFVEILNISGSTVPLSVVATNALGSVFTNGWQFAGAMEFTFPTNASLASGERLLLCSIEPVDFRTLFDIPPATQVMGPFDGSLNNGGETVELYKPGGPETNGIIPAILVDMVEYDDDEPWPEAADNHGPSLERIAMGVYGNEPTNWIASSLGGTPGQNNNSTGKPSVGFELVASSGDESNALVRIEVTIYPVSTNAPVTVTYSTTTNGTASVGDDFISTNGTLMFWPYDSRKYITLEIDSDGVALEPDETVVIGLDSVSGNALIGGNSVHTYTILDTDTGTLNPPAMTPDSTNFVNSIDVSMETDNSDAVIRYTTDGSTPTLDSEMYSTTLTFTASTRLKAKSFVGIHNSSSVTSELFLEKTPELELPPNTITSRISASSDDAEDEYRWYFTDQCILDGTNVIFGDRYTDSYRTTHGGFRFQDVEIPEDAVVTNAYIQFTSSDSGSGSATHTIYAQAADNPVTFANTPSNIGTRPTTSASASWSPSDWTGTDLAGTAQRTPNLSEIIQEIIDRDGWEEGNSIVIIAEYEADDPEYYNWRPAHTYDSDPLKAPYLYVQYATNATPHSYTTQGTAYSWYDEHAPTNIVNHEAADYIDWDEDFALNWEEYAAGTIPTNKVSVFTVLSVESMAGSNKVTWYGTTNSGVTKAFSMYRSTNDLTMDLWELVETNSITRDSTGTNVWWDIPAPEDGPAFYLPAILPPWDE